jgi:hypothetical protein
MISRADRQPAAEKGVNVHSIYEYTLSFILKRISRIGMIVAKEKTLKIADKIL